MRAIAIDSRFISSWDMCFMTSAAASSPIDSRTTADFSRSLRPKLIGSLKSASVTGYPPSDDLRRAGGVARNQRLHGFGFDAEDVLRFGPWLGRRPRRRVGRVEGLARHTRPGPADP